MKLPARIRSYVADSKDLSAADKSDLIFYLDSIKETLPEFPSPEQAEKVVKGAMSTLGMVAAKKEKPAEEKPKEKKPKEEKKTVEESFRGGVLQGTVNFKFSPKRSSDNLDSVMTISGPDAEILADMLGANRSRIEKLGSSYAIFENGELKLFKNASDYSEEE